MKSIMTKTYTVWSYDTWGNDEDGYTVNDRSEIDNGTFSPDKTDDENINDIIDANFDTDVVEIDNGVSSPENIEIVLNDDEGYPVGQIEIEEVL
jgi:hypothetical protein